MSLMRTYRRALGLSQSAFAAQLNVPLETYRPWDAGRREPPPQLLTRARTLAGYPDDTVLLPLPVLALMIGVHVRTLHAAARSGRLVVAYDTRTTFRRLRSRYWQMSWSSRPSASNAPTSPLARKGSRALAETCRQAVGDRSPSSGDWVGVRCDWGSRRLIPAAGPPSVGSKASRGR